MNAIIKATGISTDSTVVSSIEHAAIAGKQCIAAAGINLHEVDFLLNVGVYRDSNMVEPSMAALIQKQIGINPDFTKNLDRSPSFSTDLMNGAAGAINAFQVADAFFKAGRKGYVLVVSSDVHPSGQPAEGFPIKPCGAAVLLAPGDNAQGFSEFAFDVSSDDYVGQSSYVDFQLHGTNGRDSIAIETDTDFQERLLAFAVDTARKFIIKNKIDLSKTKLVAPCFDASFAQEIGREIEIDSENIIDTWNGYGNSHSSVFGIGIHTLLENNEQLDGQQILFIGAGAGLNASCALYKL